MKIDNSTKNQLFVTKILRSLKNTL